MPAPPSPPRLAAALLAAILLGLAAQPAAAMTDQTVSTPTPRALLQELRDERAPAPGAASPRTDPRTGVWPLDPPPDVVRGFDPPASTWGAGHRGADLAGRVGQEVRAALTGEVRFAGLVAGRGVVVVSHGATRTTYEPVRAGVRRGDRVRAGQVLGTLQWSGSHCLPVACLHWGLRRGEAYLDPLTLVGGPKPVRLLPW